MKKLYFILFIILCQFSILGQPDKYATALMNAPYIAFEEKQISFQDKSQPSLSILITSDEDVYSKEFRNWMKGTMMAEGKKNSGFYSVIGGVIPVWSTDSINYHFKITPDGDACRLYLLGESKGKFISDATHHEVIEKMKSSITAQVKDFYIRYYDEKINDQQKFYDAQNSDLEKLQRKKEKLAGHLADNQNNVTKTTKSMEETSLKVSESESKIKSLNAQLQQDQKASDQAQKEAEAQLKLVKEKEVEYNRLNAAGALNSKEGERVIKDLEKLRSKMDKLQENVTKTTETVTKSENNVLKEEQNKTKVEAKLSDLKNDRDKYEHEIRNIKGDQDTNESEIKDEQLQVAAALADLDKLKLAKDQFLKNNQ
jgi:hypothetical protein